MKVLFKPSLHDRMNVYHLQLDNEESVILMRSRIYKINQSVLEKGAKYSFISPTVKPILENKNDE